MSFILNVMKADEHGEGSPRGRRTVYPPALRLLALSNEIYYVPFQIRRILLERWNSES